MSSPSRSAAWQTDQIRFTDALPKTRSGKIMRTVAQGVAGGHEIKGDTTTLEDLGVLAKLREQDEGIIGRRRISNLPADPLT